LAAFATRTFTRSSIVHTDSLLSVRAAFSMEEMTEMPGRAGLKDSRCERVWPSRLLLSWTAPRNQVD
jgi:hypothetical protein